MERLARGVFIQHEALLKIGFGKIPWIVSATLLYSLTAAAWFVAPVFGEFGSVLLGSTPFPHDALLNAGILEWGSRALWNPGLSLFDWTAGFPLENTLAGTEHLIGWQLFYGPLRAFGSTVAAAYNVVLILSIVISGNGAALLARTLGASQAGAILAGFLFAFNPFHVDHAVHLQTMAIAWSPFALLGLELTLSKDGFRGPLILFASFLMTALCGMYFAVFLPIILVLYALLSWLLGRHEFRWRAVRGIVLAAAASAIALAPILIPYLRYASAYGAYPHTGEELAVYSLPLGNLFRMPSWLALWGQTPLATGVVGIAAFPGTVMLVLALFAISQARKDRAGRRTVVMLATIVVVALLLALGPVLTLDGTKPFAPEWLPLPGQVWLYLSAIRSPMRIFMYSALFGAMIAGIGYGRMHRLDSRSRFAATVALFLLAWIELMPAPWYARRSLAVQDPIEMSDAYPFLASEKDRGGVVELPASTDSSYSPAFATRYAYASAGHLRGVAAFHGSLFPPLLERMRLATYRLPDSAAREVFVSNGVTRLVVHKDLMPRDSGNKLQRILVDAGYPLLFDTKQSAVFALNARTKDYAPSPAIHEPRRLKLKRGTQREVPLSMRPLGIEPRTY